MDYKDTLLLPKTNFPMGAISAKERKNLKNVGKKLNFMKNH